MRPALILGSLLVAANANADFIGLTAEVGTYSPDADTWAADDGSTATSNNMDGSGGVYYGIAFEHPIPLIPNVRIQGTELETDGTSNTTYNGSATGSGATTDIDLSHTDYTAYYELLDGLLWLSLDAGFTFRQYDGSVKISGTSTSLSETVPMFYVAPFVSVPGTGLSVGAELKSGSFDGKDVTDTTIKVKWETPFLVGIEAGYRTHDIDFDDVSGLDVSSENSGVFFGVNIDI